MDEPCEDWEQVKLTFPRGFAALASRGGSAALASRGGSAAKKVTLGTTIPPVTRTIILPERKLYIFFDLRVISLTVLVFVDQVNKA